MITKRKRMGFIFILVLGAMILLAGCGSNNPAEESDAQAGQSEGTMEVVGEQFDYTIVGIDPGAGLMKATDKVIAEYGLDKWKLQSSSGPAMTAALKKAYDNKEPIIVTGWTPHWKFAKFDLKYLEDPKGIYGGAEDINTIVRNGLKEDHPSAYQFLDNFNWEPSDMEQMMVLIQDGMKPEEAAAKWVADNQEKVDKWLEGTEPVDGDKLSLVYVAWSSEIASTNIVGYVLKEKLGYNVELRQVEAGPMWAGVSGGGADAMVAAWLPTTHEDYYNEYKGKFEDLGPNLKGTKIGLVVPSYVEIDSIEDLAK